MQSIIGLEGGDGISITVARFYNASEKEIHGVGIEPDIKVELDNGLDLETVICTSSDNQLNEAIKVIRQKLN